MEKLAQVNKQNFISQKPKPKLVNFVVAYGLGLLRRGDGDAHKRLMLCAAILMIDPAMARLVLGLGGPGVLIMVFEVALFGVLIAYDVTRFKRPHWASLLGLGLYAGAMTFKMNVESMAWWPGFMRALFG